MKRVFDSIDRFIEVPIIEQKNIIEAANFNEAEVRFYIVDPLIRAIGYPATDDTYLKLEERLEYPYFHIGRKSQKKDLPLGFPDYRAGLKGRRGSFVIEAKAGNQLITKEAIEQAHSYAAHANVGANYFVLCNGIEFQIYETLSGPEKPAIVSMLVADIENQFHLIENILSPKKLQINCRVSYDTGLKLADGLASSATIKHGHYDASNISYRLIAGDNDITEMAKSTAPQFAELESLVSQMKEFKYTIDDGSVTRDTEGRIVANMKFNSITKNNEANMRMMGIDQMEFVSSDKYISGDPTSPSLFESETGFEVSKGTPVFPMFGNAVPLDQNMKTDIFTAAKLHIADETLHGSYVTNAIYMMNLPIIGGVNFELEVNGNFSGTLV